MKLSEIFHSIQGEGKNSGRPAIFVRLATCNLQCVWCDTPYTWDWKRFDKAREIVEMPVEAVAAEVRKYDCKNIVLTGGEPMLQQKELAEFMLSLRGALATKQSRYFFEVETNATVAPTPEFDALINQYNCSPKLGHISPALVLFSKNPKSNFKFVVTQKQDVDTIVKVIRDFALPRESVYLMPEGTTAKALDEKKTWLTEVCREFGFHFTDRLHIRRFGSRRGV